MSERLNIMKVYASEDYLAECDLDDREHTLQIVGAELVKDMKSTRPGQKSKPRVVLTLARPDGAPCKKKLVLNKTNAKTVAAKHGKHSDGWLGKWIGVYPSKCNSFGEADVPCIRVRCVNAPVPANEPKKETESK